MTNSQPLNYTIQPNTTSGHWNATPPTTTQPHSSIHHHIRIIEQSTPPTTTQPHNPTQHHIRIMEHHPTHNHSTTQLNSTLHQDHGITHNLSPTKLNPAPHQHHRTTYNHSTIQPNPTPHQDHRKVSNLQPFNHTTQSNLPHDATLPNQWKTRYAKSNQRATQERQREGGREGEEAKTIKTTELTWGTQGGGQEQAGRPTRRL